MKDISVRDICLDVIAYFGIATILVLGAPTEWRNGQKTLAVISCAVAAFMLWEGIENYINLCNGIKKFKFRRTSTGEVLENAEDFNKINNN